MSSVAIKVTTQIQDWPLIATNFSRLSDLDDLIDKIKKEQGLDCVHVQQQIYEFAHPNYFLSLLLAPRWWVLACAPGLTSLGLPRLPSLGQGMDGFFSK
jgi:hypothetical protein